MHQVPAPHDADVPVAAHGRGATRQAEHVHQGAEAGDQVAAGLVDLTHDEDPHLTEPDDLQIYCGTGEVAAHQPLHHGLGFAEA